MDTTQELIKKAKGQGIDPNEVVYSICIGDVIECIAEFYEQESLEFPIERIKELIQKGIKGLGWLIWDGIITTALQMEEDEWKNIT